MNEAPDTRTLIERRGSRVTLQIVCVSEDAAERTVQMLRDCIADGHKIRLTLPNPSVVERGPAHD